MRNSATNFENWRRKISYQTRNFRNGTRKISGNIDLGCAICKPAFQSGIRPKRLRKTKNKYSRVYLDVHITAKPTDYCQNKARVPIYRAKDSSSESSSESSSDSSSDSSSESSSDSSSDSSKVKLVKKDFYEFFVWR